MVEKIKTDDDRLLLVLKLKTNWVLAKSIEKFIFIVKNKRSLSTFVFIFSYIFSTQTYRNLTKLLTWIFYFSEVSRNFSKNRFSTNIIFIQYIHLEIRLKERCMELVSLIEGIKIFFVKLIKNTLNAFFAKQNFWTWWTR